MRTFQIHNQPPLKTMKKATHTPGPWNLDEVWGLVKHGQSEICAIHSPNKANARLIAAAPDMLDALQACSDYLGDQDSILANQVNAAISKAKGDA